MTGHAPSTIDDSRMRRLLGYVLTVASIPTREVFDRQISEPLQLRRVDYTILALVHDNVDTTTKHLARSLHVSLPYLTVTLDRMQERGLMVRVRSEVDRRSQFIRLTRDGTALLRQADAVAATMESELLAAFTPGERTMLFELLNKLSGHHRRTVDARKVDARKATAKSRTPASERG